MSFLELAKRAGRDKSDQSDQSPLQDDLLSLSALLSQPAGQQTADVGCDLHGVGSEEVQRRWTRIESLIAATPEDDHNAQWSVVSVCFCCRAPAHVGARACPRCAAPGSEARDLDPTDPVPPTYG